MFSRSKVAVFVDGCFWHGCPEHYKTPSRNSKYWSTKIQGNIARDRDTDAKLEAGGWTVIRAWEHERPELVADWVACVVRSTSQGPSRGK
ncbi:DNA mismatch repair protein Vsr [Nocardioides sp. GXQ0305]|uniref:DNA mismatch repair protein Vsr n=1 Tax=Nocardioides sp. GXQ0305 TaxID=3423912 RepID=UPI003D7EBD50